MGQNPYESPPSASSAQEADNALFKNSARYFTIYRAAAFSLCAAVLGISYWLSYVPGPEIHLYRNWYSLYAWMMILTSIAILLLPLRVLYLLIRFRFREAAIDAVLVMVTIVSCGLAQGLVPVTV